MAFTHGAAVTWAHYVYDPNFEDKYGITQAEACFARLFNNEKEARREIKSYIEAWCRDGSFKPEDFTIELFDLRTHKNIY